MQLLTLTCRTFGPHTLKMRMGQGVFKFTSRVVLVVLVPQESAGAEVEDEVLWICVARVRIDTVFHNMILRTRFYIPAIIISLFLSLDCVASE